jgi:hypothetical protein
VEFSWWCLSSIRENTARAIPKEGIEVAGT